MSKNTLFLWSNPSIKTLIAFVGIFLIQIPYSSHGQDQPIAEDLGSLINPLTGDLNYSIPLIELPGPNGESYPMVASYSSNIKVDQDAGVLGLGWSIPFGEITRTVNGIPDDEKQFVVEQKKL